MKTKFNKKCLHVALLLHACSLSLISVNAQLRLSEHLVPPPPPRPVQPAPYALPLKHVRMPQAQTQFAPSQQQQHQVTSTDDSGVMTRIARWFGFGQNAAQQQQLLPIGTDGSSQAETKHSYNYVQPNTKFENGKPCNLCNKYPWVPMFPGVMLHSQKNQQQQQQQQASNQWVQVAHNLDIQASQNYFHKQPPPLQQQQQSPPAKQRAKQFNFNSPQNTFNVNPYLNLPLPPSPIQLLPFTQPSFSFPHQRKPTPYVPAANTQPPTNVLQPTPVATNNEQQLPTTQHFYFNENVGAQSELQPNHLIPTQIPPTTTKDSSFEIVQSHQVTDYVTSVEYPATYVQSQAVDVLLERQKQTTEQPTVATVEYQHEELHPNLSSHTPGSQILTDPNSFARPCNNVSKIQEEYTTQSQYYDETTATTNVPPFASESLVISNFHQGPTNYESSQNQENDNYGQFLVNQQTHIYDQHAVVDNFQSASSHNFSHVNNYDNNLEGWTTHPLELFDSTATIQTVYNSYETTATTTPSTPQTYVMDTTTDGYVIVPSIETSYQNLKKHERERETPKRLLASPIQYANGVKNSSRSVTRDPSSLNFRFGALVSQQPQEFHYPNHAYPEPETSTVPIFVTTEPTVYSTSMTSPTSAYGAIDASGHFAGISPPAPPPKTLYQVIVPYTTKNRPRPFEPTNSDSVSASTVLQNWLRGANPSEIHEQQESKLVNSATEMPLNARGTKYLTKILANNLRELLHKEREMKLKSEGFDITKLQKNIDVWTEQEYTSIAHRPSTPTIRGRSKHIPTEYLTTTTASPRKSKTTSIFQAANSINNLENVLRSESSKRFNYVPIDDNRLLDIDKPSVINEKIGFALTTSTTPRTTTMRSKSTTTPTAITAVIASSAPRINLLENRTKELWKKTKVYISPDTKEKIYVVTPQPRFFPQRRYLESSDNSFESMTSNTNNSDSFHSPRFSVRPTPGSSKVSSSASEYRTNLFGLMGLSAFVPEQPVEIIDGNSKVVTIVTPSSRSVRGPLNSHNFRKNQSTVESMPR